MQRARILMCLCLAATMAVAGCSGGKKKAAAPEKPKGPVYSTFKSDADLFTVEVPEAFKTFKTESMEMETSLGKKTMNTYKSLSDEVGFLVTVFNMGVKVDNDKDLKVLLEMARGKMEANGTVLNKSEGTLGGYPAFMLQSKIRAGNQDVFSDVRFVYVNGRQYQVNFIATDEKKLNGPEAKRFFDSFKITGAEK
jgi:hypothetical protein